MEDAPDPALVQPEMPTRVLRHFLRHLVATLGAGTVDAIGREAGLPLAYLDTDDRYVSRLFLERFAAAACRQLHGLDGLAPRDHAVWQLWRDAGRETMSPESLGPLLFVARSLGSPRLAYGSFPVMIDRAIKYLRAEVVRQAPGFAEVRIQARDPVAAPDCVAMCWQRVGMLEGIPLTWRLPRARVEHPECCFDPVHPAGWCVYRIRYMEGEPAFLAWALLPGLLGGVAGGLAGSLAAGLPHPAWTASLGALAGLALEGWRRQVRDQGRSRRDAASLYEQLDVGDQRYRELWHERQALRRTLLAVRKIAGYLPAPVVERITRAPEQELTLGGQCTDAAVLFADLVSFTRRCEGAPPQEVVEHLNLFFAHADPVIEEHQGVIDKRLGDGVMVVFTSREGTEPAGALRERAVRCGLALLRAMEPLNRALADRAAPPLALRAGLAAGPLVQGNMGSGIRLEYTVIGDVVNVASRLNGHAAPGCLLAEASALPEGVAGLKVRGRREVSVKGREQPVAVVELAP